MVKKFREEREGQKSLLYPPKTHTHTHSLEHAQLLLETCVCSKLDIVQT